MLAIPVKKNIMLREAVRVVTEFVRTRLSEKKLTLDAKANDMGFEEDGQKDIISVAMETGAFTTEDLVNQSKTLLAAGHETSATAVTWGIYLLSLPCYSHIQSRLRAEIRAHLPSPESGEPITSDMLDSLPYLNAVSKEIMRVHPPVPMMARLSNEDTDICGVKIPKGTDVRVHVWAVNKSKKLWGEDARIFRPERWLEDVHGGAESLSYLTFGYGPRSCIGRGE
jgi:cytochrome P450